MIQRSRWNPFSAFAQKRFYPVISALILASVLCGCALQTRQTCVEERTAFDIGSASLKMKTARVDFCRSTTVEILGSKEVKVPFAENMLHQQFSREIQVTGIEQLQSLQNRARRMGSARFAGAATAAFREARNAPAYLAEVKNKTGIDIRLISQDEEAVLGYLAATTRIGKAPDQMVVWDIGGHSMQITVKDSDQHYCIYRGLMASISFKNQIIEKIQHRTGKSPNPIGKRNLPDILTLAMAAAADVPDDIKRRISREGTTVIGIGGVHNSSILKQTGNISIYRQEDLAEALQKRLDLNDAEIGGQYADTDVSNLILVLGFMKKLDIREVRLADVNLTDGVLIDPVFWQ